MKGKALLVLVTAVALLVTLATPGHSAERKEVESLDQSEELSQRYLDAFKKSGVPTPKAVEAAFQKARASGTIESWQAASSIANSYANVVDVLKRHYSYLYDVSKLSYRGGGNMRYIETAANYEGVQNKYLQMRNDAYIELAKLHLAKGDRARALSYVVIVKTRPDIPPCLMPFSRIRSSSPWPAAGYPGMSAWAFCRSSTFQNGPAFHCTPAAIRQGHPAVPGVMRRPWSGTPPGKTR